MEKTNEDNVFRPGDEEGLHRELAKKAMASSEGNNGTDEDPFSPLYLKSLIDKKLVTLDTVHYFSYNINDKLPSDLKEIVLVFLT